MASAAVPLVFSYDGVDNNNNNNNERHALDQDDPMTVTKRPRVALLSTKPVSAIPRPPLATSSTMSFSSVQAMPTRSTTAVGAATSSAAVRQRARVANASAMKNPVSGNASNRRAGPSSAAPTAATMAAGRVAGALSFSSVKMPSATTAPPAAPLRRSDGQTTNRPGPGTSSVAATAAAADSIEVQYRSLVSQTAAWTAELAALGQQDRELASQAERDAAERSSALAVLADQQRALADLENEEAVRELKDAISQAQARDQRARDDADAAAERMRAAERDADAAEMELARIQAESAEIHSQTLALHTQIQADTARHETLLAEYAAEEDRGRAHLRTLAIEHQERETAERLDFDAREAALKADAAVLEALQADRASAAAARDTAVRAARDAHARHTAATARVDAARALVEASTAHVARETEAADNAETQIVALERKRRALHNAVLELKGNIRVFARVRPTLSTESSPAADLTCAYSGTAATTGFMGEPDELVVRKPRVDVAGRAGTDTKRFKLDRVFGSDARQVDVFDEIAQLVTSAMDGYNVTIFAYGQTGSGKTFTMLGPANWLEAAAAAGAATTASSSSTTTTTTTTTKELAQTIGDPYADDPRGMIPRAIDMIFATAETKRVHGWDFALSAQCVEVYLDTISDLFAGVAEGGAFTRHSGTGASSGTSNGGSARTRPAAASTATGPGKGRQQQQQQQQERTVVDVAPDPNWYGELGTPTAERLVLSSPGQAAQLLHRGMARRMYAATALNRTSSRSHLVFSVFVEGTHRETGEAVRARLNLVDLAGCENLAKSGALNDPKLATEAKAINVSLSTLGNVISRLGATGDTAGVPFRQAKLTRLLQTSLSGTSKVLMVVNVSPLLEHVSESCNALTFAVRVNHTKVGTAVRNRGAKTATTTGGGGSR
ncbi:P-loop containing nucleoside triphosphate hydrolase protein [Blastocladiella britannica]|nr:P-loop containing nucleoside triphosphate hydrolase protein [Blastocladiella britannica]